MYRIAILVAVFARVCFGATPGKLVAPGIVEVALKDGEPYNITCPPIFKKNVGDFFQPDDYEGMVAACLNADFDTVEGCDKCLAAFVSAAFNKPRFSGNDDERQSKGTFEGVPFAIIPQLNFSNGCPFAQACKSDLLATIDDDTALTPSTEDDALGAAFGEMIDKCQGPKPGPDYAEAYEQVQKIIQARSAPTSSPMEETPSPTDPSGVSLPTKVFACVSVILAMII